MSGSMRRPEPARHPHPVRRSSGSRSPTRARRRRSSWVSSTGGPGSGSSAGWARVGRRAWPGSPRTTASPWMSRPRRPNHQLQLPFQLPFQGRGRFQCQHRFRFRCRRARRPTRRARRPRRIRCHWRKPSGWKSNSPGLHRPWSTWSSAPVFPCRRRACPSTVPGSHSAWTFRCR